MPLNEQELQLWLAFLRTSVLLNGRLAEEMRRKNRVPIAWYDVLVHLYHGPAAGLRMQDLAERMVMSNSGLTRLLDRMVDKGLIRRELCAEDRRVIFAVLTDRGRALLEELLPQHQARVRCYFIDRLTEEEIAVMGPALERVLAGLTAKTETA